MTGHKILLVPLIQLLVNLAVYTRYSEKPECCSVLKVLKTLTGKNWHVLMHTLNIPAFPILAHLPLSGQHVMHYIAHAHEWSTSKQGKQLN